MTREEIDANLKPCPFCGGKAYVHDNYMASHVKCDNRDCGARTKPVPHEKSELYTDELAMKLWNNRIDRDINRRK